MHADLLAIRILEPTLVSLALGRRIEGGLLNLVKKNKCRPLALSAGLSRYSRVGRFNNNVELKELERPA
jgi:hypothetical protein